MDYTPYYAEAIVAINEKLAPDDNFTLKDLFSTIRWNELSAYEKRDFGRFFSNKVKDGLVQNVQRYEPDKKGPSKYIKTR